MDAHDLPAEQKFLRDELAALKAEDEIYEAARRERQQRRDTILMRLGAIVALTNVTARALSGLSGPSVADDLVGELGPHDESGAAQSPKGVLAAPPSLQAEPPAAEDAVTAVNKPGQQGVRRGVRPRRRMKGKYGLGIKTVRTVLKAANGVSLSPPQIRKIAADDYGVALKPASIRSALVRLMNADEVTKEGTKYLLLNRELPFSQAA